MSKFVQEQIRLVKDNIDIVDFIGEYVKLEASGNSYIGLCPFHMDKHPSLSVSPDKKVWKCFSQCNIGGDIFSFYQKYYNVDFETALVELADKYGINIGLTEEYKILLKQKETIIEINKKACGFFKNDFNYNTKAKIYLEERFISDEMIKEFKIGSYCSTGNDLSDYLISQHEYTVEDLTVAGIVKIGTDGKHKDCFKGRIIIPFTEGNRILGFTSRSLDDWLKPKYLNTTVTPVFNKNEVIFGFDQAKKAIKEFNSVIVVEGQFDVIRCHQVDIKNVIGLSGTAFLEHQIKKISRFTNNFYLALDSDKAGQEAIVRTVEIINKFASFPVVKVVELC